MNSTVVVPANGSTSPTVVETHDHNDHNHGDFRELRQESLHLTRDVGALATQAALTEGRSLVEAAKNAAAGILESAKNAAATQILVQTKADATTLQIANGFSALSAQMAECCCETKMAIRDQADKVIDRVDEIEDARIAVELVDAKTEIAFLKAKLPNCSVT